jgi:RimJ/RimL family protein N-acetyltransferase
MEIRTQRLLLRHWRPGDRDAIAAINRDPEVARYLNRPVDAEAFLGFVTAHWKRHGFGFWALESREPETRGALLGFAGVAYPDYIPELTGRPELGWRLARDAWGRGLATEAMLAAREDAVTRLELRDLIAVIHPRNVRSRRLAERLGMRVERSLRNPWLGVDVDVWSFPDVRSGPPRLGTVQAL